jgi:hypothetical protein
MKRIMLKKLLLLAAMVAMVLAVAIPAVAGGANTGNAQNVIGQDSEQEADSGDIDQSLESTGSGDNSNQCLGFSATANTGNAQNAIDLTQYDSEADDFEFDDSGSFIAENPVNTTHCDQQVNQAASAFGG